MFFFWKIIPNKTEFLWDANSSSLALATGWRHSYASSQTNLFCHFCSKALWKWAKFRSGLWSPTFLSWPGSGPKITRMQSPQEIFWCRSCHRHKCHSPCGVQHHCPCKPNAVLLLLLLKASLQNVRTHGRLLRPFAVYLVWYRWFLFNFNVSMF